MVERILGRLYLKFTLLVLVLILVFTGTAGMLLYHRSIASLEREAYGRLEQMVSSYAKELDIDIANTIQITDTLATLMSEDFDREKVKQEPGYLDRQIQRINPNVRVIAERFSFSKTAYIYYNWQLDGSVHDIYYADSDHDGTVSRQKQLPIDYYDDAGSERGAKAWWFGPVQSGKSYWSQPYKWVFDDGTSTVFLSYTRAVFADNTLIGVAGTDFRYDDILAVMKKIKVYDTGYPFLIDGDKHFIIHPRLQGKSLTDLKEEPFQKLREEISFKNKGAFSFREIDGEYWFITYHRLRNDWTLGLAAPLSEITESARSLSSMIIVLSLISFPLICLIVFLAARKATAPIDGLTDTVNQMIDGDFSPHISSRIIARRDELGKLGRAIQSLGFYLEETRSEPVQRIQRQESKGLETRKGNED